MAWVTIANVRGPRGLKGDPGDPLNQAGWDFMKANFDALDGKDIRASWNGGRGTLHSHPDANGRETWLAARDSDGGPTDWAMFHLMERLGILSITDPTYIAAVVDSAYRYTDLTVRQSDGQVPDWVMDRWAPRIADRIGSGSGGALTTGDRYVNSNGDLVPCFPDLRNITGWGSSSMQFIGDFLAAVFSDTGATFHGEGKSAENSQQISARMGSIPALITVPGGSIPASGSVVVTSTSIPTNAALKPFTGTLNGVHGTLSSTTTEITFTRTTVGSATAVPAGTPFVSEVGNAARNHVTMLWNGKNNMGSVGAHTLVIEQTNTSFDYLSPLVKRCLVIGHFVDSDQTVGSTQYNNVLATNSAYASRYGDLYFDVRSYVSSPQLWVDTGITPTSTDLAQQADGIKPDSVSQDAGHFNTAGNTAIANAIKAHISNVLHWY